MVKHHTGPVVVDLSEVPFMDSTGVHVLMGTLARLEPQNRALALVCHEEGQVHRILALAGLLDTVTVYRSLESAVIAGDDVSDPPGRSTDQRPSTPAHAHWAGCAELAREPAKDLRSPTFGIGMPPPATN